MSVIKHKAQRVVVLIDVQNLYHSARNLYNARANFKEVVKAAVAGRQLVRAIGYVIRTESGEEKAFLEALVNMGIETKIKDLQVFAGGMKKADWDVGMAVDAVRFAEAFVDAIVLVTGDGDFVPLVEYLHARGVQSEVMAFGRSTSQRLREAADDFIDLGADRKFLLRVGRAGAE
ncbi:MAG: NYN domain-containing protein [Candidatus Sungbacteria bacterium]|uniref:NYN domain-containing protein n=1 Tax=Candidatus Sungbacteria bacterium RIFCSPHIGHO2_02_FULL_52_23 TaxID=1802274 RepID=A0A1G2KVF6_9BACT|nr:NYN domain-containing protein [Candidatus Sungbacteria bacterium]OHA02399.1 MAG: hypothetical protein A3J58_01580 [Candidatus Sungbacteria bacterium RIFCSPHIGHO2_02_FULL_52_23]